MSLKEFQPTHPHGVRRDPLIQDLTFVLLFQPTHPHGVRQLSHVGFKTNSCFNPRTRTGCD